MWSDATPKLSLALSCFGVQSNVPPDHVSVVSVYESSDYEAELQNVAAFSQTNNLYNAEKQFAVWFTEKT
jgi:hypothetical protein